MPPDEYLPIHLQAHRVHRRITDIRIASSANPGAGIETAIKASIGIEPGNPAVVRAIDEEEIASDEHLAIRLDGDRTYPVKKRGDAGARIKTGVQTAIAMEPCNASPVRPIESKECASDQHLSIRLQHDCRNAPMRPSRSRARIETGIQTAVGIEPGNPVSGSSINGREMAGDKYPAVRLNSCCIDRFSVEVLSVFLNRNHADAGRETGVVTPIGIQPGDARSVTDQNLAIRLQGKCKNTPNGIQRIETAVAAAVRVEPGDVRAHQAFDH